MIGTNTGPIVDISDYPRINDINSLGSMLEAWSGPLNLLSIVMCFSITSAPSATAVFATILFVEWSVYKNFFVGCTVYYICIIFIF